jgi:hypothetical protein
MMKKLLVLMLVLGISSAATAVDVVDIVVSSVGPAQETTDPWAVVTDPIAPTDAITIGPSEWVDLDIVYRDDGTGVGLISLALQVIVGGPGTLYVGETGLAADNTLLTFPPGAWDLGTVPAAISFINEVDAGKVYQIDLGMNTGLMGEPGTDVIALDHLLLHCDGEGDVSVTVVNDFTTAAGATFNMMTGMPEFGPGVTITQIPEPMTLALLGLGGLFLVRRKK